MFTSYLFPHRLKRLGWLLVVVAATLGLLEQTDVYKMPPLMQWLPPVLTEQYRESQPAPRANTDLYAVLLLAGGLLAACSREQHEDEYISKIRLDSLLWALYAYCALLALAFLLISGIWFLNVMTYAMFAPLLLFLMQFQVRLRLAARALPHEQ